MLVVIAMITMTVIMAFTTTTMTMIVISASFWLCNSFYRSGLSALGSFGVLGE